MFNQDPFTNYKFECNPDCQDRKVGCRSGCERYARDTALRESIKAAMKKEEPYKYYTCDNIAKNMDKKAKKKDVKFKINQGR